MWQQLLPVLLPTITVIKHTFGSRFLQSSYLVWCMSVVVGLGTNHSIRRGPGKPPPSTPWSLISLILYHAHVLVWGGGLPAFMEPPSKVLVDQSPHINLRTALLLTFCC